MDEAGAGAQYSPLYYRCHRIVAHLFLADAPLARTLSLAGRRHVTLDDVVRQVSPRPPADHSARSRSHLLPALIYNSAPPPSSIDLLKDQVVPARVLSHPIRTYPIYLLCFIHLTDDGR